jgi:hypothetical protein
MLSPYKPHPRKPLDENRGAIKGGLALSNSKPCPTDRKSNISKEKSKVFKEVKEGKQLTIKGALRAYNPSKMVPL